MKRIPDRRWENRAQKTKKKKKKKDNPPDGGAALLHATAEANAIYPEYFPVPEKKINKKKSNHHARNAMSSHKSFAKI